MSTTVTPACLAAAITRCWNASLQATVTIQRTPIRDLGLPLSSLANQSAIERAQTAISGLCGAAELLNAQPRQEQRIILDALCYSVPLKASDSVGAAIPDPGGQIQTAGVPERNVRPQRGRN
jgi:hypothetical protein